MEKADIQGLLIRSHKEMKVASYVALRWEEVERGRNWLQGLLPQICNGLAKPEELRLQIAFTYAGLEKLGIAEAVKFGFSVEFIQGMDTEFRARVLGDEDENDSQHWRWGSRHEAPVDLVLIAFAVDATRLDAWLKDFEGQMENNGLALVQHMRAIENRTGREHFGFRDGISQPTIKSLAPDSKPGSPASDTAFNEVNDGEFVLGYLNGYNQLPDSPALPSSLDAAGILPDCPGEPGYKDLGRNGSYLVFRQLRQQVARFWEQIGDAIQQEQGHISNDACIELASRMVGRWPNGTPLVKYAHTPGPDGQSATDMNTFQYAQEDPKGTKCPWGSHIRRSYPRNAMPENKEKSSLKISNRHRILRRGRLYGPPFVEDFDPAKMIGQADDGKERGLLFLCFNTNISRQFEFIQHTWCNNTKFAGLYRGPDPLISGHDETSEREPLDFVIPQEKLRRRVRNLRRHVHVVGGAYFFMPGIRALEFIAHFKPLTNG